MRRAGLETLRVLGSQPDVLHLHEWQCSAAAMLYWEVYHDAGLRSARIVLTIHNMDNSGECRQDEFGATGVSGAPLPPPPCPAAASELWHVSAAGAALLAKAVR